MESSYMDRSDYFEMIANKHIKIAHNRPISIGSSSLRKSFHRINDEDELITACVNWGHFPCVVHFHHLMIFRQNGTGLPDRVTQNGLLFLAKQDMNNKMSDTIETAYGEAEDAMNIFIQFMRKDNEENGTCGELFLFDANKMTAEMYGPINDKLFGWLLTFEDEHIAKDLKYDAANFFDD